MMHKTCPINYGHLADLQKALPTIDLNKKNLSFDKISPRDFYFCPFFSICTCTLLWIGYFCNHKMYLKLIVIIISFHRDHWVNRGPVRLYSGRIGSDLICFRSPAIVRYRKLSGYGRKSQLWHVAFETHWGWVTHICVSKIGHRWLRFQWNFNPNTTIFNQENDIWKW